MNKYRNNNFYKKIKIFSFQKYALFKFLYAFLFIILIIYFSLFQKKTNHHIHIAMSMTNNYVYIIMVSITSILINSKKTTFINFHLLIGNDFKNENKKNIYSLKRLNKKCKFNFYNVGNNFKGWIHGRNRSVASFYRIILGEIIEKVDKIIYLDGDTLIYNDLSEMYKLNMKNLYFRGIGEIIKKYFKKNKFICAGVMLMNLKLIKKYHVFKIFQNYYLKNFKKGIYYGDQYIINILFNNKIGFLPPKFGMHFINEKYIVKYMNLKRLIYSKKELKESINRPIIRHFWGFKINGLFVGKPWQTKRYDKFKELWNYYAKKTGKYTLICKTFKKACIFNNN